MINTKKTFNENYFVSLLLPLLCKNGIYEIDENELSRELYYYYKKPEFKELFQDVCKMKDSLSNKVDITDGLNQQKFLSGNIYFDSIHFAPLHLCYDQDIDLSEYEKYLSQDGINKMNQLVQEFGIRYSIKKNSHNKMNIYGTDPNMSYGLVSSERYGENINLELLTDGDISKITSFDLMENKFFFSPYAPNEYIIHKNAKTICVNIENATYAISRGNSNNKINYFSLFTNIVDREKLEKIMQIGNTVYNDDSYSLTQERPYVRKLSLK